MNHRIHLVRVTDLEQPDESYIAYSIEAAKPQHRKGYARAVVAGQAIQIDQTTYEHLHASQEEI